MSRLLLILGWTGWLVGLSACSEASKSVPKNAETDAGTVDGSATTPQPVGCVDDVTAGHHVYACNELKFDVEVGASCAAGNCGVVLDVHGRTMNAAQEDLTTQLRSLGPPRGYLVVQPTAELATLGPSWNPDDDDDKVWNALTEIRRAFLVDPRRVHLTGFSQGGAMTFRLGCKHADEVASIAPAAAGAGIAYADRYPPYRLDCNFDAHDAPARGLAILQMHGTKDGLVPIEKGRQQRDAVIAWLSPTTSSVVAQGAGYTRTRHESTRLGTVFDYIEHEYEVASSSEVIPTYGHCIPGGIDLEPSAGHALAFTCAPPTAFVWGQLVLDFFAEHPLP